MGLKPGYKKTGIGAIPADWEIKVLGDVLDLIRNGAVYQTARQGGVPITRIETIWNGVIDMARVGQAVATGAIEAYRMKAGDILYSHINSVDHIGKVAYYSGENSLYHGMNLLLLRAGPYVESRFLYYWLGSTMGRRISASLAKQAVSQASINTRELRSTVIPIPCREEQRAIATALSDVDVLLTKLDQLIAKKRDIKQAAMQQLLTGKTRLPGFSGEWGLKRLGELGVTYGGLVGKTKSDFGVGEDRYVTFVNVMNNVVMDDTLFEHVLVQTNESQNLVCGGDLLFNGSSETPEEVGLCSFVAGKFERLFLNSFCFGFRLRDGGVADGIFLAYYMRGNQGREVMKSLAQGSTRYNISKSSLLKAELRLPGVTEQRAISSLLSDMDAEIHALEARRDKTQSLKQGMMQELLTGRIRLPVNPESSESVA